MNISEQPLQSFILDRSLIFRICISIQSITNIKLLRAGDKSARIFIASNVAVEATSPTTGPKTPTSSHLKNTMQHRFGNLSEWESKIESASWQIIQESS